MARVLFVCLGNICRSPTAEAVFRGLVARAGLADVIEVDSAGTGGWHAGEAPDRRMQQHAAKRGYDLSPLRARQVLAGDFEAFDWIIAMDGDNLRNLKALQPATGGARLHLMGEFCAERDGPAQEVPDPYYGGAAGFERVLDMLEDACEGLLTQVQSQA